VRRSCPASPAPSVQNHETTTPGDLDVPGPWSSSRLSARRVLKTHAVRDLVRAEYWALVEAARPVNSSA
jgi:hypothetical protein